MIIYNILFYIKCVEQLSQFYDEAEKTIQQKTISDMVKIWLFYNSSSESFWTGMTSTEANIPDNKKVKEHLFSNLSSAKYMLSKNSDMHQKRFCDLSKVEKICEIIKFMQWNFTTSKENQKLKPEQDYARFYTQHNGDPAQAYNAAGINLHGTKRDKANDLSNLFKRNYELIIEIKLNRKYLKSLFTDHNSIQFSNSNFIFISNDNLENATKEIAENIIKHMSKKEKKDNDVNNVSLDRSTYNNNLSLLQKILKSLNGSISIHDKQFETSLLCIINNDKTTTNSV
jgi:hypothetical protein